MPRTGRPPKLDEIIGTKLVKRDPGTDNERVESVPVTRIEQIVGDIRVGLNAERAAARAGIHRDTQKDWEHTASAARAALAQGLKTIDDLTEKESSCLDFSDALHDAEIEWELQANMLLQGLAQGGQVLEIVTTKRSADGKETTTTRRETTLPDRDVLKWRLRHRFPERYTERVLVEGTGDDGAIPIAVRAASLAETLAQLALQDDEPREPDPDNATGTATATLDE